MEHFSRRSEDALARGEQAEPESYDVAAVDPVERSARSLIQAARIDYVNFGPSHPDFGPRVGVYSARLANALLREANDAQSVWRDDRAIGVDYFGDDFVIRLVF